MPHACVYICIKLHIYICVYVYIYMCAWVSIPFMDPPATPYLFSSHSWLWQHRGEISLWPDEMLRDMRRSCRVSRIQHSMEINVWEEYSCVYTKYIYMYSIYNWQTLQNCPSKSEKIFKCVQNMYIQNTRKTKSYMSISGAWNVYFKAREGTPTIHSWLWQHRKFDYSEIPIQG